MADQSLALRPVSDVGKELLAAFTCSREELAAFLIESAHDYSEHGLTETAVAFVDEDPAVAAYFSLSADGLQLRPVEKTELGLPFDCTITYFPAVKITKLAVRSDLQGKGIGSQLMKFIEGLAFTEGISVRLLTVDAVNEPDVIGFYQRHGFKTAMQHEIRQAKQRDSGKGGKFRGQAGVQIEAPTVLMYRDLYNPEEPVLLTTPIKSDEAKQVLVDAIREAIADQQGNQAGN